ncbi:hypothetical protein CLOM_g16481 [Closterium sp. NIES-68]|nr:hypothetical protein CLOM_g16481 [Closterium sp. NIES-68]
MLHSLRSHNRRGSDRRVMGLFDGRDGKTEVGSTAEMAKILGVPVVLVLDCWSMSRSAAAMVHGYASFDPSLRFAGIVLNKVASAAHAAWLTEALESAHVRVPVLGGIPKSADVEMPERHLGLHRPGWRRTGVPAQHAERLAALIEAHLDLDRLLQLAADVAGPPTMGLGGERRVWGGGGGECGGSSANELPPLSMPPGMKLARIGVARDDAFCFYYHDNLSLLREAGAEIVFFSPLTDPLPHRLDAVYFGGGYPELHAAALAANAKLVYALRAFAAAGGVVYGECGGLMYLSRSIETKEGEVHEMCGLLPFRTRMVSTLKLAYCTVRPQPNCVLFPAEVGEMRGQFFHFSEVLLDDGSFHGDQLEFGYLIEQQTPGSTSCPRATWRGQCWRPTCICTSAPTPPSPTPSSTHAEPTPRKQQLSQPRQPQQWPARVRQRPLQQERRQRQRG